ncbi:unnamed protein product [Rotaria socialis]|uniref:Uncharacterized protein n=1 Tax=Rotaria socialis TaxID=392032 RepID=A0A819ZQU5_9BILA|nr:unnamed protein product [Rotaria socialis]CAF3439321.1 unnamed protein product [Rotaria socialis]CAF4177813.1 unnamed protein product [Rotaria socialis]CAF4215356.1 unnamed protein product [Rotaria socialis]
MSECDTMQYDIEPGKQSVFAVRANELNAISNNTRKFNITYKNDEQSLVHHLLREPLPDVIIKVIGTNNEKTRISLISSIQYALQQDIRTMMEQTNIWILNGTRQMIGLEEYDETLTTNNQINPNIILCEQFGKSQLFTYHATVHRFIDKIICQIQLEQTFSKIPIIALFVQGNVSSVADVIENNSKHIPIIILKGTGLVANQLAVVYESQRGDFKNIHTDSSKQQLLSGKDFRRLADIKDTKSSPIFVCQPGRDQLDESILRAFSYAIKTIDSSHARVTEFGFAIRLNKINYAQTYILNHDTIIYWTDDELDVCLENAILLNAVSFVELLLRYGASLRRLALTSNFTRFTIKPNRKKSHVVELMEEHMSVPVYLLDRDVRLKKNLRLLFCWAVENQYFDLVLSICTRLEDSIVALLLVSQWCQYKENNDHTTSINYRKHRQQFQKYAADILDLYHADNEEKTRRLLNEKSNLYQEQEALALIDDLCSKTLVSTKCLQSYTNTVWYGKEFHVNKNFVWEILICLVCICPLLLFIPFVHNRIFLHDNMNEFEHKNSKHRSTMANIFELFRRFYHGNAFIRFRYNMASYIVFLILFSYTILFDYFPLNIYQEKRSNINRLPIPITELIVHIFLVSIAFDELRQIISHVKSVLDQNPFWTRLEGLKRHRNTVWSFYRNDPWNILDFAAFTFWIIGFATRFIVKDTVFAVSKIFMSLDLCLWYMRCLHVFLASETLGPKLIMIFHTMKDLILFLLFIFIFYLAYTITTYSLISTSSFVIWSNSTYFTTVQNGGNLTNMEIFRNIIEWGTWKIFGSTSLTTSDSVNVQYSAQNDAYGFVTLILTIAFLIIAYVLLLNNLIALFNFTIQRVHGESHPAWCYNFYVVLREYEEKDMFVPPLNLLLWPISYMMRRKLHHIQKHAFTENNDYDQQRHRKHQQRIAERYWKEKQISENRSAANQPLYVSCQCKCRGAEVDPLESTSF